MEEANFYHYRDDPVNLLTDAFRCSRMRLLTFVIGRIAAEDATDRRKEKVAMLIHHLACHHFCSSSSRLFSRIICHNSFRCISFLLLSPASLLPPSLVRREGRRSNRDAKESSPRSPFASALAGKKSLSLAQLMQRECNTSAANHYALPDRGTSLRIVIFLVFSLLRSLLSHHGDVFSFLISRICRDEMEFTS